MIIDIFTYVCIYSERDGKREIHITMYIYIYTHAHVAILSRTHAHDWRIG